MALGNGCAVDMCSLSAGVPLSLDIPSKRKIETESMQATVLGVGSLGALDRTDGHWDSDIGLEDENLPEVPPDGE